MTELHLVTYASWRYESSRQRLLRSAARLGAIRQWTFGPTDFRRTAVYRAYPEVSRTARGGGLWLWKPLFIRYVLERIEQGDLLMYLDAGIEIRAPLEPLVTLADRGQGVALFRVHERLNRQWTKRDCFVLMDCDRPEYRDSEQTMSGIILLRKSALTVRLVDDWLNYATDVRIVSDRPNECGLPNYVDFVEHRHDQSILNNLRIRYGLAGYSDPTQYGEPYRAAASKGVDDYGTLLLLHRERAPSWRTALRLLASDRARFCSGFRSHVRRIYRRYRAES